MTGRRRVLGLLRAAGRRVLAGLRRLWRAVKQRTAAVRDVVVDAAVRHRDRVREDSVYARSIAPRQQHLQRQLVGAVPRHEGGAGRSEDDLGHDHHDRPARPSQPRDYGGEYSGGYPGSSPMPPVVPGSLWDRLT